MTAIVLLCGLAAIASAASIPLVPTGVWEEFKRAHGKKYHDPNEDGLRKMLFERHLVEVIEHNKLHEAGIKTYSKTINKFADMFPSEVPKGFKQQKFGSMQVYVPKYHKDLPASKDWRSVKGVVTNVKDQGQCGSCWAFSSTGSLEGQMMLKKSKNVSLSEQQLVDCSGDFGNDGCGGGLMTSAFEYIKSVHGIESESAYPYTAMDGNCKFDESKVVADVTGFHNIPKGDEEALKTVVATEGPVSVAIDATWNFQGYEGGVFVDESCNPESLDHGVLAVGYGTDEKSGQDYWIVKNSWGASWGEKGFIKMARNKDNMCGIATMATIPIV